MPANGRWDLIRRLKVKLSFVYADWAEERILLPFLFVLISRHPVFFARAMCELLNVTVAALCISQQQ